MRYLFYDIKKIEVIDHRVNLRVYYIDISQKLNSPDNV